MKLSETESIIEGILFAAGDAVELEKISDILDIDEKSTRAVITALADKYKTENRGLQIIRLEDSYQMCTRSEYHEYISRLAEPRRNQSLSNAAMEVLAIVAYKQPVTRSVIEQIRGVSCDTLVNKLLERGLIEETGRLDAPGRPMLFGTTEEFLRCFGIESVTELPEFAEKSTEDLPPELAAAVESELSEEGGTAADSGSDGQTSENQGADSRNMDSRELSSQDPESRDTGSQSVQSREQDSQNSESRDADINPDGGANQDPGDADGAAGGGTPNER